MNVEASDVYLPLPLLTALNYKCKVKSGKFGPVHNQPDTTPWRRMGQ
jgi:hypothetical protein